MMTAAEVEPVQLVQIFAEAFFKGFGSRFQVIGILLAEGVEVQPIQQRQQGFIEVGKGSAQSGAGCARVIDGMTLLGGMFGIDAQTGLLPGGEDLPGILLLSLDTLARECLLYGQEPAEHALRLLAHGMGHLAGLDHGPAMDRVCAACFDAARQALRV